MIYGEDSDAIATALTAYRNTPLDQLDPELRSIIISTAVRHGGDLSIIDDLLKQYQASSSAELQQDIASGLTSTKDTSAIQKLLATLRNSSIIRSQDTGRWYVWLLRNRDGRSLAWQWLRDNWTWIEKTFAGDKSYDDYPRYSAGVLSTQTQLDEYREFFTPLSEVPSLTRVIAIGIVEIEGRVNLIERDGQAVRDALAKL
ncbi:Aminopeptidase N [compost metagenome]